MKWVRRAALERADETRAEFLLDDRHLLRIVFLDEGLVRFLLLRDGDLRLKRTWSVCPGAPELPYGGRPRISNAGFPGAACSCRATADGWTVAGGDLEIRINREPFFLSVRALATGVELSGCPTGFLSLGRRDDRSWNLWRREERDRFYGLGEKAGDLERGGRRFDMRCLDAMGYDARSSDPLYKHYPFLILKRAAGSVGLYYDNFAPVVFDTGQERDNYHGEFFSYRAGAGDLDLYLIFAPRIKTITERFSHMTGRTRLLPRWSLGYSGSTMAYTDAPDAQARLENFVAECERQDIPCHSFQLSSGYTAIGHKRYVFHWNRERIPDPEGLLRTFHAAGQRVAANVKPVLLDDHPRFAEVRDAGLFVRDSSEPDRPALAPFWDGEAAHLDFTNPDTRRWWRENLRDQLFACGVDSIWNDNNEYEIWDDRAICRGVASAGAKADPVPIELLRPVQTFLMMQNSYRAHRRHFPGRRPWAISRSGCPGMQRYVQTWSGDNHTDWETLRYNIRMGLSLSLCGMYNLGHDVGGFAGPAPDPELLVRWVQNGIFHPRFTIHSWNEDGSVTEPWMYPEVLPLIRAALRLRLRFAPYLYQLLHRAHVACEPILRPTFYDHEDDHEAFQETDDFMLGESLLVAGVVAANAAVREVYLPRCDAGWVDYYSGRHFAGGQRLRLPVTLESLPLFVKAGHALPLTAPEHRAFTDGGGERRLLLFPGAGGARVTGYLYEDDGETTAHERGDWTRFAYEIEIGAGEIDIQIEKTGDYKPPFEKIRFETRSQRTWRLKINGVATDEYFF